MLARARVQARHSALALRVQVLAFLAWTKPALARAQAELARIVRGLLPRLEDKPQLAVAFEAKTLKYGDAREPLSGVVVAPMRAQTMVLEDPTHLDLVEVRPPNPEASDSPRMSEQA